MMRPSPLSGTRVELVDVAPRDGLQSEGKVLDTATKVELIGRLVAAGLRRIEAVSFARPDVVPQMADAEAVIAGLPRQPGVSYIGLVLNERGVQRAIDAGVDEVNAVVAASDSFSVRNQNVGVSAAVDAWRAIADRATAAGLPASVTIAVAFGCPYEGELPVEHLAALAAELAAAAPSEIALADTIGAAVPDDVIGRISAVREVVPALPLRCHFHNTRNTGIANAYAALQAGVATLDASVGGIGGCPFAPRAVGNVPTEDLVYLLDRSGIETGASLGGLIETASWLAPRLGHELPGLVARAGPFPADRAALAAGVR